MNATVTTQKVTGALRKAGFAAASLERRRSGYSTMKLPRSLGRGVGLAYYDYADEGCRFEACVQALRRAGYAVEVVNPGAAKVS